MRYVVLYTTMYVSSNFPGHPNFYDLSSFHDCKMSVLKVAMIKFYGNSDFCAVNKSLTMVF